MATIRRPGAASAAVLIGLSASMIGAHLLAPEWSRRAGLDVWNYAAAEDEQRAATDVRAEMDARAERAARRRALADQLAARLVTREATLATVADELSSLFGDDTGFRTTLTWAYPEAHEPRLQYACHAIERAGRQLDGPARDATIARLEAEYRAMAAASPAQ